MGPGDPEGAGDAPDDYERAACGLLTIAQNGTIRRVNGTICAWTGFAADELLERRFQDLLTVGSKLFHQTHWMPLLQMQGSVAEVQFEMVHRGGRVFAVLVNAARRAPSPDAGAPLVDVAVFVATDRRKYERELLLARRRAEELLDTVRQREGEFRALAENSPDAIARFDRERRFTYVNPAAERLRGRAAEASIGRRIEDVGLAPDLAAPWVAAIDEALAGREATIAFTLAVDGGARELQARVVPERDARGEVVTVLGIIHDVTALRQQEREAQQRAVLAEQLVGIVSHDLRNPLGAVLLGAHLLQSVDLGASARTVGRIASAAERASRLINDLLDFTQARLGGGLRVVPREIDPHALVADCLEEVKLAWPGRALAHRRVGGALAYGDPDRIAQVVSNLANNALSYGAADEPVTVTTEVAGGALELRTHNAGGAIPPEVQEQMFEPMRRGEERARRGARSVGLGLYIVRAIAEAHGGRVRVRSVEGEGTTFVVTLPRGPERAGSAPPSLP